MPTKLTGRHHAIAGLMLVVLGAVGIATAFPAAAGTRTPAQAGPVLVPDNPTCADLAPAGTTWTELKVEPVQDGQRSDGTLTVTLDVVPNEATGPTFNWTSNIGVDAVFVKGGPNGNLYLYNPESTGATGLHAPTNPANNKFYGLSHVSFCYDVENVTTTTTQATTTTTQPTTTTTAQMTTTTAAPSTTAAVRSAPAPTRQLPRTGSSTGPTVMVGGLLLAAGIALVACSRRLRHT